MPKDKKVKKECEYSSFWDCHSNKESCRKHFKITKQIPPKIILVIEKKEV